MKGERPFVDANVVIYAFAKNDPRAETAEKLLALGGIVTVQNLNEFAAVAVRKLAMPWKQVVEALSALRALCPTPVPLTVQTHEAALRIVSRFGYSIYDSLVIAAALEAGCTTLLSEDLRDGHVIESLPIRNPFASRKDVRPRK
jgi:predicted nucleic acid-binding protein